VTNVLILPGLYNSGPDHWQTLWEASIPSAMRVQQRDWEAPDRTEWVATLDAVIRQTDGPIVFATHSLGCALAAWWMAENGTSRHASKVIGALLVAPPDVERENFPRSVRGFAPMPRLRLPFKTIVVASTDDPWCTLPKAQSWAADWGAEFESIGLRGHINGESGLGMWPQGRSWLDVVSESAQK
jgi:hypothetical protein